MRLEEPFLNNTLAVDNILDCNVLLYLLMEYIIHLSPVETKYSIDCNVNPGRLTYSTRWSDMVAQRCIRCHQDYHGLASAQNSVQPYPEEMSLGGDQTYCQAHLAEVRIV